MNKTSDEYRTPPAFFKGVNAEFSFNLDVAASEENALCSIYYTPEISALENQWGPFGTVAWCNPPYSPGNIPRFLAKAVEQKRRGVASVLLVPLDPGRSWMRHVIGEAAEVRAVVGRIRFLDGVTGEPAPSGAAKPSALIVYRPFYFGPTLFSYVERRVIEAVGTAV
jgi:phage N-6-adenine-methyltransferase